MAYLLDPYPAPSTSELQLQVSRGSMSGLGAFPGEIGWFEVWIDMWALERSVGV
jgi:hypothetical protein